MSRRASLVWLAALAGFLAVPGRAAAIAPVIKDEGKFFSADAIKKANEELRTIARESGKDLVIETFSTVPGDQAPKVKAMTDEEREKFFSQWAEERIHELVVDGVYILICKEPARLEIRITQKARAQFGKEAYDKLREQLLSEFRNRRFDEGLLTAVKMVREKLAPNTRSPR
jgi:uncharacterized membrane protein YgcG